MDIDNFKAQYFNDGYILTELPQDLISKFWYEIHTTNWIKSKSFYNDVPEWYAENNKYINIQGEDAHLESERIINKTNFANAPQTVHSLARDVSNLSVFDHLKTLRNNLDTSYIHVWNGTDADTDFHQDVIDGSNILVLCYFTDEPSWDPKWGGSITVRKRVMDNTIFERKVLPNNGVMLIVNNDNPLFMHKVEKMYADVNRYTFAFSYKWSI
jgi:Rps23 Pro-64 3,4-dihydroxylase Tpa1-like proline 4-hydroxylase